MILLIYLLKLVICSALLYGYYFLFLRNKRMHQYNRFYLLAGIILSIVIPLIKMPLLQSAGDAQPIISKTIDGLAFGGWEHDFVITAKQNFFNSLITLKNLIASIYIAGLLLVIYPILRSLFYIRSLSQKHPSKKLADVRFYDTTEPGTPFSFFNTVFWNSSISIETDEGRQILSHELYHVQQKHSYDILFMQLACAVLWFNPFCYLMNKELKIIHEFLADEYAMNETDKHQYAQLLVLQAVTPRQIFISNQFFYNQIKRRITMILQNNTTHNSYIRKLMTVPVLLLIFCACSVKKDDVVAEVPKKEVIDVQMVYEKPEVEASFPGGPSSWQRFLGKHFRYPMEAQEKEIQGTVVIQFRVDKDGTINDITAVDEKPGEKQNNNARVVVSALSKEKKLIHVSAKKEESDVLKNEAIRVVSQSGKWVPATNNGVTVMSWKKQPITFKLEEQ